MLNRLKSYGENQNPPHKTKSLDSQKNIIKQLLLTQDAKPRCELVEKVCMYI